MQSIFIALALELNAIAMAATILLVVLLSLRFVFSEALTSLKYVRGGRLVTGSINVFTVILAIIFVATTLEPDNPFHFRL